MRAFSVAAAKTPAFRPGLERPHSERGRYASHNAHVVDDYLLRLAEPVHLLSLDVFDTLVSRGCGSPTDLFLLLARRLSRRGIIDVSPEVFARGRERSEQTVWLREGGLDSHTTLDLITEELCRRLGLDPQLAPELARLEFELELEMLEPTPQAVQLLRHRKQVEIAFTSDTYFTKPQILTILEKFGLHRTDEHVLVSSDLAASKATGAVFDVLLDLVGLEPGRVLHVGDNPHSDVDVPRSRGLHALWLPEERLTRFERQLSAAKFETEGLSATLAGASRSARLSVQPPTARAEVIRDVAAGVVGPALIAYVLWTLLQADREGLRRLYFLSRDGQVLHQVARRLAPKLGIDLDLRYLAISRQSTNLAATFDLQPDEIDWVFRDAPEMSLEGMLSRFDLQWSEVAMFFPEHHETGPPKRAIEIAPVLHQLLLEGQEPLRSLVLARAEARRKLVLAYLEQEGIADGIRFGIVDFGGVGSQVRALWELTASLGVTPPSAFLVGLDSREIPGAERSDTEPAWLASTHTWLYDHRRKRGWSRHRGFGTLFQIFCGCDHGTVTGYNAEGKRVLPVFSSAQNMPVIDWGLNTLRETVDHMASTLVLDPELVDPSADLRDLVVDLIDDLWSNPSQAVAQVWGDFPMEGANATDGTARPLARRYTMLEVIYGIANGKFPDLGWLHWFEASLTRSPLWVRSPVRLGLQVYERAQASRHPLLRSLADTVRSRRERQ